jgi:hypothetical protein
MWMLDGCGVEAFDVTAKSGAYRGLVVRQPKGHWAVYFNSDASRGSARKFASIDAALEFMTDRRAKKGWAH